MSYGLLPIIAILALSGVATSQSRRVAGYSESTSERTERSAVRPSAAAATPKPDNGVIRVETDLVTVPVRVSERNGRAVAGIARSEFKIFENGAEQELAYFSADDQPFTVALALDMSYSSVFKLKDIQAAAKAFTAQLRPTDRVMVVGFAEKTEILCEPTNDRRILSLAIDGSRIKSGTSLYDAFGVAINEKLKNIPGRKAVIVLSDGVDTTSSKLKAADVEAQITAGNVIVYPIQYATFDDVRESRRKDAEVHYDDDDRPYLVEAPLKKGQRESDYAEADEFFARVADISGGHVFRVSSRTNLAAAFSRIAEELRKIYSLGYYPSDERRPGAEYDIKVRVYRPNLTIRTRENYSGRSN
ncbi:MAG: VWA domain-containing protein [Acidobacteriota bacterium]